MNWPSAVTPHLQGPSRDIRERSEPSCESAAKAAHGPSAPCQSLPSPTSPSGFAAIRLEFAPLLATDLPDQLRAVNAFRNAHIAHGDQPLLDAHGARAELKAWICALVNLARTLS